MTGLLLFIDTHSPSGALGKTKNKVLASVIASPIPLPALTAHCLNADAGKPKPPPSC